MLLIKSADIFKVSKIDSDAPFQSWYCLSVSIFLNDSDQEIY